MPDDDATREAPADVPLATTEFDPVDTAAGHPLAYSDHTSSIPVVDYEPPRVRAGWIVALVVLAAVGVAIAAFFLGRTTTAGPDVDAQASTTSVPVLSTTVAPPPATLTVQAAPTTVTVTVTTRDIPQIACASLRRYDNMTMNDVAMNMVENMALGIGFNDAKVRVVEEVRASCPEFLNR